MDFFESNDTFREIFQSAVEAIILVDDHGKILMANPVSEQMFGYGKNDLINRPIEDLIPDRFRNSHTDDRKKFVASPKPRAMGKGMDLMAKKKDGSEFPVEVSLSFTRVNNKPLIMSFINDITVRKESEEAVRRSEEQLLVYAAELEKKVHARTEALKRSIEKLERSNRVLQEQILERQRAEEDARKSLEKERELNDLKTKFVSIASHEFRTPLSSILTSASLINQYKEKKDLEKIDKHVNRVKSSVIHLTNILNDFLSLGKLEEGRVEIIKENIDLSLYIDEIVEEFHPLLKDQQRIALVSKGNGRPFHSDPKILRNILFNLISNASKYSDPGKTITITCLYEKDLVKLQVIDEGIGIPESELKHLFDRFFRATNATNIQGTGLGLNIVKRYLDLLDGSITFTSSEGVGSTFTIAIPYE